MALISPAQSRRPSRPCPRAPEPWSLAGEDARAAETTQGVYRSSSRNKKARSVLTSDSLVKYETDGTLAKYQLKHPRETRKPFQSLSEYNDSVSPSVDNCANTTSASVLWEPQGSREKTSDIKKSGGEIFQSGLRKNLLRKRMA